MITPQEIVDVALAESAGDDLAVIVTESSDTNLRWAVNTLTTNGFVRRQEVDVVAFSKSTSGVSTATASGNVGDANEVRSLVAKAKSASEKAAPAEDAAPLEDGGQSRDWADPPSDTTPGVLASVAMGLGEAFYRGRLDEVEHFGYAEHEISTTYLGTTANTRLRHSQPQSRLEMTAKSHSRTRSAWIGTAELDLDHVDVAAMEADLQHSLALQGHQIQIDPGRHRVLLSPSAVADLMIELYWSADARSAIDGRSVFSAAGGGTRVGETISDSPITLSSNPADAEPGMACADFEVSAAPSESSTPFDNGLGLGATDWISHGRLRHLVNTRHTAQLAGIPVTPGIDNLTLRHDSGSGSLDEVAQRMGDGLLITCLWYNRVVDPATLLLTGLTRDGVYVVRGGEIAGSCGNFRFNDSPVSMLGRIVEAGGTVRTLAREMGDYFNQAAMPPLVVGDFHLSTSSEAL